MSRISIESVSIIGAGNVATHLAAGLYSKGIHIHQIWSRNVNASGDLAAKVNASACADLSQLDVNVSLVILAVKDDVISEVCKQLPEGISSLVHTSGSADMDVLKNKAENIGVFYPIQSFNKEEAVAWMGIPICVETSNDDFTEALFELGNKLTGNVSYINSTQRIQLHIAAIFVNNFSNFMNAIAYEVLTRQHMPFNLLKPLIEKTASRLSDKDPFTLQTGPAKRGDIELIKKHLALLENNKTAKEIYELLSYEIMKKSQ